MLLSKLHERYPKNIPNFIQDRFDTEWEDISFAAQGDLLLLYLAVIKAAEAAGQPIWNNGFGSGSFLFYLLDKGLNPLEPHWECKDCGYIERDEQAELCFDLPVKDCPKCGKRMNRDGIHASPEIALRNTHLFFYINEEYYPVAIETVLNALKSCKVFQRRYTHQLGLAHNQTYYYTDKVKKKDRPLIYKDEFGVEYINIEHKEALSSNLRSITFWIKRDESMKKHPLSMEEWIEIKPDIRLVFQHVQEDLLGNPLDDILEMIEAFQPDSWTDFIKLICYSQGTYKDNWPLQKMIELMQSSDFCDVLYAREPLQFYLQKQGIPNVLAYRMVEEFLRGNIYGYEMDHFMNITPHLEADQLFYAAQFLWPRTHAINWLWRNMRREDFV